MQLVAEQRAIHVGSKGLDDAEIELADLKAWGRRRQRWSFIVSGFRVRKRLKYFAKFNWQWASTTKNSNKFYQSLSHTKTTSYLIVTYITAIKNIYIQLPMISYLLLFSHSFTTVPKKKSLMSLMSLDINNARTTTTTTTKILNELSLPIS